MNLARITIFGVFSVALFSGCDDGGYPIGVPLTPPVNVEVPPAIVEPQPDGDDNGNDNGNTNTNDIDVNITITFPSNAAG